MMMMKMLLAEKRIHLSVMNDGLVSIRYCYLVLYRCRCACDCPVAVAVVFVVHFEEGYQRYQRRATHLKLGTLYLSILP